MKKILLLAFMLTLTVSMFSQTQVLQQGNESLYLDTLTNERDTIIKHRISAEYEWAWQTLADTLDGTADATIELVVALAPMGTTPPDSAFTRLAINMRDTLALYSTASADPPFLYDPDGSPYNWIGLRFTVNSVTKWDIRNYLILRRRR